jgi:hypothetical protein
MNENTHTNSIAMLLGFESSCAIGYLITLSKITFHELVVIRDKNIIFLGGLVLNIK